MMDKLDFQEKKWGFIFGIVAIVAAVFEMFVDGISVGSVVGAIKDVFGTAVVIVVFYYVMKNAPRKPKNFDEELLAALDNWRDENSNMIVRNPQYDEEHKGQGPTCYSLDLKTEVSDFYKSVATTKNTGLFLRMPMLTKENYCNGNIEIRFYLNKGTFFGNLPKETDLKENYETLINLFTSLINEKYTGFAKASGKNKEITVIVKPPIITSDDIDNLIDMINTMYTAYLVSANL